MFEFAFFELSLFCLKLVSEQEYQEYLDTILPF